jgi:hypothetical protein
MRMCQANAAMCGRANFNCEFDLKIKAKMVGKFEFDQQRCGRQVGNRRE